MSKILISLLLFALIFAAPGVEANRAAGMQAPPPKPTPPPAAGGGERAAIEAAVREALGVNAEAAPGILMYEEVIQEIRLSEDGEWALVFMAFADPETGEIAATEPGLAFAPRAAGAWNAILPASASWPEALQSLPEGLLAPEEKADWWVMYAEAYAEPEAVGALGGYYLPWNGGERMRLTGSTAHDSYINSGSSHYAFDFANGTMFPIHAAKPGTVHSVRVECKNGDEKCSNWLILEDTTTTPTTYQLYLHLAQESVPAAIRAKGTRIRQGQFLGLADDTGASTGHHLHFHVHTNPNTWWAPSLDITFVDVAINGGRPRITKDQRYCTRSTDVCAQTQDFYVSGNIFHGDAVPPQGGLTAPQPGALLNSPSLSLQGWASDVGLGVLSSQFVAYYNDAWHDVGRPITTTTNLAATWDLCAAGVPEGPLALALRVLDKDGNEAPGFPGLRQVVNNASCPPPPTCTPGPDQAALFSEPDYGGACVVINKGTYNNAAALVPVGDNNTASIRLGANVQAQLFSEASRGGHREVLASSDLSLADNATGLDTLSSIVVETAVSQTGLTGAETEAEALPEILAPEAAAAVTAPWSDAMQDGYNGWTTPGSSNLWDQTYVEGQNIAWWYGQDGSEDYRTSTNRNSGNLATPIINLPNDGKTYYLRFRYRYQTESPGAHWDWRKLQVSVDGGSFTDLLQLSDDPMDTWLQSPAISLKDYNGKALQFRFQFDTRDGFYNNFDGWFIDDFSINATAPPACADGRDTPAQALSLTAGTPVKGEICPGADVDYYKFRAAAGERIGAVVDGISAGSSSKLDATLTLLDADGKQILAWNDDQSADRADPWLSYAIKRSGDYYLRVQAWDHPSGGSANHSYTLRLFKDSTDPVPGGFQTVEAGTIFGSGQSIPIRVAASDSGSGVSHVTFLWHSGDWAGDKWVLQGEDWDGSDGWGVTIPAGTIPCGTNIALYAQIHDWAGNSIGAAVGSIAIPCEMLYLPLLKR